MDLFEAECIADMHATALRALEDLGIKVLLPEAREIYRTGGARVENEMVHIGREMVDAALASAPRSITCRAGSRERDVVLEQGRLVFQPGAGAPPPRVTM